MAKTAVIIGVGSFNEKKFISLNDLESWCKEYYMGLGNDSLTYESAPFNEALILLDNVKVKNTKTGCKVTLKAGTLVAKLNSEMGELPFIEPYFLHLLENNINNLLPLNNTSIYEDLTKLSEEDIVGIRVAPYTEIRDVTPPLMVVGDICLGILSMFKTVVYVSPLISGAGLSMSISFEKLKDSLVQMEIHPKELSEFDFTKHTYHQKILFSYGRAIMTESQILSRLSKEIKKLKPP